MHRFAAPSVVLGSALAFTLAGCGSVHARRDSLRDSPRPDPVVSNPSAANAAVPVTTAPSSTETSSATKPAPRPRRWLGVAASPAQTYVMAAWTKTDVLLSADGGETSRSVLSGAGSVETVSIDERGDVVAVRRHRGARELGVRDVGGATHWRVIPHATKTLALAAVGGAVTWHGVVKTSDGAPEEAIAISRDEGATWVFPAGATLGSFANHVQVDRDGTVRLMAASEADCGGGYQARFVGNVAGGEWQQVDWPLDTPTGFGLGAQGWAYGIGDCGDSTDGQRLCGAGPAGGAVVVQPAVHLASLDVVTDGRATWATIDGKLANLREGTVRFPARTSPRGLRLTGVDAQGQPVGVASGAAVRWTRAGAWQPLFVAE